MDRGQPGDTGHPATQKGASGTAAWKTVGIALLLLVIIGSVIIVVALDPTKLDVNTHDPTLATTSRHGATGFVIALGVFLIALVTVLPYVALSRLRFGVAELPSAERQNMTGQASVELEATSAGRDG